MIPEAGENEVTAGGNKKLGLLRTVPTGALVFVTDTGPLVAAARTVAFARLH